ncbi:uncharacterized protein [Haliotis cracherodii]|uniref:uncharacterized protein n=1 Tax=Haliotis cracherodii TaxID=6455 RepID=UPI0039E8173A
MVSRWLYLLLAETVLLLVLGYTFFQTTGTENQSPINHDQAVSTKGLLTMAQYGVPRNATHPENVNKVGKYIIYTCNDESCGGLADRQEGIITSYILSQMLKRNFGLSMERPCNFSNYVIPNSVKWQIDENMLKNRSREKKVCMNGLACGRKMKQSDLEKMFDKDVTFYKGNIDYVPFLMENPLFGTVQWAQNKSHHEIYRIAFSQLFKLSPSTMSKYESFNDKARKESGKLFCAHLRIGKSKNMPTDRFRTDDRPDPITLIQFLKKKLQDSPSSKLFIATDNDEVRFQFKDAFPLTFLDIKGNITHIDQGGRNDCSGFEKGILDQYVLTTCDTLVISDSGFSRTAAVVRGTDNNLFIIYQKNITQIKRMNPSRAKY